MSRNNEFISYIEYTLAVKDYNLALAHQSKSDNITQKHEHALQLRKKIKKYYSLDELEFKIWISANKEFIKTLTKQEKENLIKLFHDYNKALRSDDNVGTEEIQHLFEALSLANYTEFISEYIEDYEI